MNRSGQKISLLLVVTTFLIGGSTRAGNAQQWVNPVIKGYGAASPLPTAAVQPDRSLHYKLIFDVPGAGSDMSKVNPGLVYIARCLNVFGSAGVMPSQMKLAAVMHTSAVEITLNNEIYRKKFGVDNPNLALIADLVKNGVELFVCGQSLAHYRYEHDWVNPNIVIALSAQVVLPTYQLQGYALMVAD